PGERARAAGRRRAAAGARLLAACAAVAEPPGDRGEPGARPPGPGCGWRICRGGRAGPAPGVGVSFDGPRSQPTPAGGPGADRLTVEVVGGAGRRWLSVPAEAPVAELLPRM